MKDLTYWIIGGLALFLLSVLLVALFDREHQPPVVHHCDAHEQLAACNDHSRMCRDVLRLCNRDYADLKTRVDVCLGFETKAAL